MKNIVLLLAALGAAGLAQAQSHSVTNYSNPPGTQADSKAATDATPGHTATAHQQDNKHPDKGLKDAAANKGKPGKTAKQAKESAAAAGAVSSTGSSGSSGTNAAASADQAASADKSQSPTASVYLDGASKGGAEATMQVDPSERALTPDQQAAFDVRGAGGSASSNGKK